jgi:hypothetical protein
LSEPVILWLFGTVITLQTIAIATLGGKLWEHVVKCGDIHSRISRNEVKIEAAEKDMQGLRDWKHITVDPLIPRAVEEHERRINRLDTRMDER